MAIVDQRQAYKTSTTKATTTCSPFCHILPFCWAQQLPLKFQTMNTEWNIRWKCKIKSLRQLWGISLNHWLNDKKKKTWTSFSTLDFSHRLMNNYRSIQGGMSSCFSFRLLNIHDLKQIPLYRWSSAATLRTISSSFLLFDFKVLLNYPFLGSSYLRYFFRRHLWCVGRPPSISW